MIEVHDELEASRSPRKKRRHGERPKSVGRQQSAIEEWKPSINIEEQEIPIPNEPDVSEYESELENHRYAITVRVCSCVSDTFAAPTPKALKSLRLPSADSRALSLLRAMSLMRQKETGRSDCTQTTYAVQVPTHVHEI